MTTVGYGDMSYVLVHQIRSSDHATTLVYLEKGQGTVALSSIFILCNCVHLVFMRFTEVFCILRMHKISLFRVADAIADVYG